jgi:hypothetical protein
VTGPAPTKTSTTAKAATGGFAAILAALAIWFSTHRTPKPPVYDPAKDTTLVFIGKDKLGKKCEDPTDTNNPATCAWVIPDSNGYAKKVVPMNDEMWAARDTMMKQRFDAWFAVHGHTDSVSLEGVKVSKYDAKTIMDSVYKKEGHYPTVKLVDSTK